MNKLKMALFVGVLVSLFACTTTHQPKKARMIAEIGDCARDWNETKKPQQKLGM